MEFVILLFKQRSFKNLHCHTYMNGDSAVDYVRKIDE